MEEGRSHGGGNGYSPSFLNQENNEDRNTECIILYKETTNLVIGGHAMPALDSESVYRPCMLV